METQRKHNDKIRGGKIMNNVMIMVANGDFTEWNVVFENSYKSLWYAKKVFNKWINKTIGQQITAKLTIGNPRGNKYYALYCGLNKGEYIA